MNSEELELSLRTEFENYLKNALADMKQEVSDFQAKFQTELEDHKSRLEESFKELSEKIKDDTKLEDSFKETVTEHLKLARDEGARITATAIAEAEKMEEDKVASESVSFSDLRDAIDEISSKDSQSEILKALVHYAAQYTPRGAFFIVKNEHLVGWRVFGREDHSNPQSVREVFFPVASNTALGESIKTLATIESNYGSYEDDSIYLNQLEFGQPEKMYSIPLVARGRGVAVLYADAGNDGDTVNSEALETLVRVAGLTVEVLASSKIAKTQQDEEERASSFETEDTQHESNEVETAEVETSEFENTETESNEQYSFADTGSNATGELAESYTPPVVEEDSYSYQPEPVEQEQPVVEEVQEDYFSSDNESFDEIKTEAGYSTDYDFQPIEQEKEAESVIEEEPESTPDAFSWNQPAEEIEEPETFSSFETSQTDTQEDYTDSFEPVSETQENYTSSFDTVAEDSVPSVDDYQADLNQTYETETPVVQFDDSSQVEENQFDYHQQQSNDYEVEAPASDDYSIDDDSSIEETPAFETSYQESYEEEVSSFDDSYQEVSEEVEETPAEVETVAATPARPRFGDRNVDLPIEVAEDERRLHNDARRFARLLVSEIKLYNEQKVKEGRESSDLYERLREAIDRSREMYDKRVQPPVAAKFDYFHYELVNTLAEGEEPKLGGSYPGANV